MKGPKQPDRASWFLILDSWFNELELFFLLQQDDLNWICKVKAFFTTECRTVETTSFYTETNINDVTSFVNKK